MKWFRWLLPALVLVVVVTTAPAQTTPRKKHHSSAFDAQRAMLCNTLVFLSLPDSEKQIIRSVQTPDEQARLQLQITQTKATRNLFMMSAPSRNAYLAALPDENRNLYLQLLAAFPAAVTCAEARSPTTGGSSGGSSGGTTNPPVNPSCTTSSAVDANCPCNSLTVQDTRTDPTTSNACCCPSSAPNSCNSNSTLCPSSVEWMYAAGAGLLLVGRWAGSWRKRRAAAGAIALSGTRPN
jgi:hypothetical protein